VYKGAAVALAVTAIILRFRLPRNRAESRLTYPELIKSVMTLPLESGPLREVAFYGACAFGALSGFWSTLVFFLARPPYHYGAKMAGTLALAGIAAALAAPLVGRSADRKGPRFVIGIVLVVGVSSYLPLYWWGDRIAGLLAGIILLDFSVNACNVSDQAAMYAAVPNAASRADTFYMVAYFTGGAVGTELSSQAWDIMGWPGVCAVGAALFAAALVVYVSRRSVPLASPPLGVGVAGSS
jgi:predicted MFS family arabinose efflux permease